jgi:hypothetical protein
MTAATDIVDLPRAIVRLLAALLACTAIGDARPQGRDASEAQLKAAFAYNLARFVEWPAASFPSATAPLRLCVSGRGALPNLLAELDGKTVQGRDLAVLLAGNAFDPATCHIVFFAAGADHGALELLRRVKDSSTLTVSDAPGFVEQGGAVELVQADGRLQFDVNLAAVRKAGLRLSANLLKLAHARKGESN